MKYIKRHIESALAEYTAFFPVTAILGPRQCGKSTLIKEFIKGNKNAIYLDLELASNRNTLQNPEQFFEHNKEKQVCLDEIQRLPGLFETFRSAVDSHRSAGQFIVLGSASRDLIRQSSESLAGRIGYLELSPFTYPEIQTSVNQVDYWIKGGFPDSVLTSLKLSRIWRTNFIRTFLERDIPQIGYSIPSELTGRLWRMLAHQHGQLLNLSNLGNSLGVSHTTVRNYIDILNQTFMTREVKPFESNLKKRLVRSPKLFIRDSGILHSLLDINDFNDLMAHPVFGFSWEGMVLENIYASLPESKISFYRTSHGAEIDFIVQTGKKKLAIECKVGDVPKPTKGFWLALNDIQPDVAYIVAPHAKSKYPLKEHVWVTGLKELLEEL